jgi:hypothetical protein
LPTANLSVIPLIPKTSSKISGAAAFRSTIFTGFGAVLAT